MDGSKCQQKLCFVTIGATATFDSLIRAALDPAFLRVLKENEYTDLRLQYGKDGASILKEFKATIVRDGKTQPALNVTGFDFNKHGLSSEMRAAKDGVVISHAGSGSILEALRLAAPLIVVPNSSLLDNHQEELAEEMAAQGYAIHGHVDEMPAALVKAERLRQQMQAWPSKNARGDGRGLVGVMDDELGFVD